MLECFKCHQQVANTLKDYFQHLKFKHGCHSHFEKYCCSQGHCCRTFSNKYTFTDHLRKQHKNDFIEHQKSNSSAFTPLDEDMCTASCSADIASDISNADGSESVVASERDSVDVTQLAAGFIAETKSCISTLSTVHRVMRACQQMVECVVDDVHDAIDRAGVTCPEIDSKLHYYRNPFAGLETEYAQMAYMKSTGTFVKPETYVVGNRQAFITDKVSKVKKPVMETVTAQYVPISDMITALSSRTDIVRQALTNRCQGEDGSYRSYFDGSVWNEHALKGDNVLVLRLYGDDFEPCNPLGSRKTVYKVGCIYYQFENLASSELSKTDNIFLAACYHTEDLKEFGWKNILRPLVTELRALESDGMEVTVDGKKLQTKVVVGVFTGDNLFLNGIMGFVESFVAHKPCRLCTLDRSDFQKVTVEDSSVLRTVESYDHAVENVNVQETGIKDRCVLNELTHFHAAVNCTQDVMHDVFEGVLAYDLLLICRALVQAGHFTGELLNHRIQTFDYGYHDTSNRPPVIVVTADTLPFDASQTWCLMRILAVAVGDLVPEDDPFWHFYLSLRCLMDVVLAPTVSEKQLAALPALVSEYLEQHLSLFPQHTLKNKHHHLIHYATLIRRFGPLMRYSCMRFESKHQRSKKLLHIAGNFKNVPKSCAYRHQHNVAFRLLQTTADVQSGLVIGPGSVITLSELQNGYDINSSLENIGMYSELYDANWIEITGVRYKHSAVVMCGIESETTPIFIEVQHILVRNSASLGQAVWFVGEKFETRYFNSHFHAWCVEKQLPAVTMSVDPRTLTYTTPVSLCGKVYEGNRIKLIALRYHV